MKNILIIGAGRSASSLIKYLLENSSKENWKVTVGDVSLELAEQKARHSNARAIAFDINNEVQREQEIEKADIVVSMLPASMHLNVAKDCVRFKKHLVTASYVSMEMAELDTEAKKSGVVLLNEMGLDPGIDHMSAMQIIDRIKAEGGEVTSFKSYCGGLIAPESNDNPWGYKFTWNPRNVVLAGQGTAKFIENGKYKYIPYNRLFQQIEAVKVDGHGSFDAYANRDSLSYRKVYDLERIPTMLRGTLRMAGYCKAWNTFVQLGLTDDTYVIDNASQLTWRQFIEAFLPEGSKSAEQKVADLIGVSAQSEEIQKLKWLGVFDNNKIKVEKATPAQIFQNLLEEKWKLKENDKDMVVMQHEIEYKLEVGSQKSEEKRSISSLVVIGEDQTYTAMAKTVGLPVAIGVKLILQNKIKQTGVAVPVNKKIYDPVLEELEQYGILFKEKVN